MKHVSRKTGRLVFRGLALSVLAGSLAACGTLGIGGEKKQGTPTLGNRTPILSRIANEVKPDPSLASVAVVLPPAQTNPDWPQAGGNAAKAPGHVTWGAAPARAWTATKRARKAAGLTILIELAGAMVAVGAFVVAWFVR